MILDDRREPHEPVEDDADDGWIGEETKKKHHNVS